MNFDNSTFYAFVVDGEVAHIHGISNEMEKVNAVMSSNPTVVKIPSEILDEVINLSSDNSYWTYQNGEFYPPKS